MVYSCLTVRLLAINITATFVHNEPTSLAVIQDLELPQALYDAVEANEHPSFDVRTRSELTDRVIKC